MAEDRLSFPDFKQGAYHKSERNGPNNIRPYYYKYGGREATSIAMEEGGIGGKWMVMIISYAKYMHFDEFYYPLVCVDVLLNLI